MDYCRTKSGLGSALKVYSTSVPPPDPTRNQGAGVSGFTYRAALEHDEHESRTKRDWQIPPAQSVVKDIVEREYSSDLDDCEILEDKASYPDNGFPAVSDDWKERCRRSSLGAPSKASHVVRKNIGSDLARKGCRKYSTNRDRPSSLSQEIEKPARDDTKPGLAKNRMGRSDDERGESGERVRFRYPDSDIVRDHRNAITGCEHSATTGVICRHKSGDALDALDGGSEYALGSSDFSIKELVTLSRSAVPQMRSIALGLMSTIVERVYNDAYSENDCRLIEKTLRESNARISARLALDDSYFSVVERGLDLLAGLTSVHEEEIWELPHSLSRPGSSGSKVLALSPKSLRALLSAYQDSWFGTGDRELERAGEGEIDPSNASLGEITALARTDLVAGLLASDICSRLLYIISTRRECLHTVKVALCLLARIARHSAKATNTILGATDIITTLTDTFLRKNFCPKIDSPSLLAALYIVKLFKVLASNSRRASEDMIKNKTIDVLMRYLTAGPLDSSAPETSPDKLQDEIWILLGSIFRYEIGFSLIEQYSEVILEHIRLVPQAILSSSKATSGAGVPFLRALLLAIELSFAEGHSLGISFFTNFINSSWTNSRFMSGPASTAICDIISLYVEKLYKGRSFGLSEGFQTLLESSGDTCALLESLVSPDTLSLLIDDISKHMRKCEKLTRDNTRHYYTEKLHSRYGIGNINDVNTARELSYLSLMCEEWAAKCKLCVCMHIIAASMGSHAPASNLLGSIRHWIFSKDALRIVSEVADSVQIQTRLLRNGSWIFWFMYGLGESLLAWINACEYLRETNLGQALKESAESTMVAASHRVLLLLAPGRERDALRVIDSIFSHLSTGIPIMKYLKAETISEEASASSELTSARMSDSASGFIFEPSHYNSDITDVRTEYLPLKASWPTSLISRLSAYSSSKQKIPTNKSTVPSESVKEILQCILNFHELPKLSCLTSAADCAYTKPLSDPAALNMERLAYAYNAFLIPGEYFKIPEISASLIKILTSAAFALQKYDTRIDSVLNMGGSFFRLYCKAVENFKSESFGDSLYAKYLLFMLRDDVPDDYLYFFLSELEDTLFLFESFKGGPMSSFLDKDNAEYIYDVLKYEDRMWFPRKNISVGLLTSWFRLLISRTLKNSSFLHAIGISFISNALFGHYDRENLKNSDDKKLFSENETAENYVITKKQIAQFILENEETCPHNITCDEVISWKDWPSYYYERKQSADVCAKRRQILESLLLR